MKLTKDTLIEGDIILKGTEIKIKESSKDYTELFRKGRNVIYTNDWTKEKFEGSIILVKELSSGELAGTSIYVTVEGRDHISGRDDKNSFQFRNTEVISHEYDIKYNEDVLITNNGVIAISG